jgi:hypothetical protein
MDSQQDNNDFTDNFFAGLSVRSSQRDYSDKKSVLRESKEEGPVD